MPDPTTPSTLHDVLVIGGSYAGLAAALQLARARRRVLLLDAGLRRNRKASAAHGFLGQDGRDPAAIAEEARRQLLAYPTVGLLHGTVTRAKAEAGGFEVAVDDGASHRAKRLILATGLIDELPAIPGLAERWGRSVFGCPYCHGYELDRGRIGVLAAEPNDHGFQRAMMMPDWGDTTLIDQGGLVVDEAQRADLTKRGVRFETAPMTALQGDCTVVLADGRRLELDGLFVAARTRMASPIAEQLGCAFDDGLGGPRIRTTMGQTSVAGVFACGDAAKGMGNIATAVADGNLAGVAVHRSLVFETDPA